MQISENRERPWLAKEIRLMCPHCQSFCFVSLPWDVTPLGRQIIMRDAIEEHRKICEKAPAESGRVYRVDYPRV